MAENNEALSQAKLKRRSTKALFRNQPEKSNLRESDHMDDDGNENKNESHSTSEKHAVKTSR